MYGKGPAIWCSAVEAAPAVQESYPHLPQAIKGHGPRARFACSESHHFWLG